MSFLRYIDRYGSKVNFNLKGKPLKSSWGGFISIFNIVWTIYIISDFVYKFLSGGTYTIDTIDSVLTDKFDLVDQHDFLLAYNFFKPGGFVKELDYVKTEFTFVDEGRTAPLPTSPCSDLYSGEDFDQIKDMTCVDITKFSDPIKLANKVKGAFPRTYINLKLRPCSEDENCPTSDKVNPPEIGDSDHFIRFYFNKDIVDTKSLKNPLKSYLFYGQAAIKKDVYTISDFIHKQISFTNTFEFLLRDAPADDILSFDRADTQQYVRKGGAFFESAIYLDVPKRTYNRKFVTFFDTLAKIGGFVTLSYKIGRFVVGKFAPDQKKRQIFNYLFEKASTGINEEIILNKSLKIDPNSIFLSRKEERLISQKESENSPLKEGKQDSIISIGKMKNINKEDFDISLRGSRIFLRNLICCLKYNREEDIIFKKCKKIFSEKMDLTNYFRMDARVDFLLSSLMTEEEKACFKSQKLEIDNNELEISDLQVEKAKQFFGDKIRSGEITDREIEAFNALDSSEKLEVYKSI